jgi:hypothetical protein
MRLDAPLIDVVGIDGLEFVVKRFGPAVAKLSIYQSEIIDCRGQTLAILRMCETNFRIAWLAQNDAEESLHSLDIVQSELSIKASINHSSRLILEDNRLGIVTASTSTKPPHRISSLSVGRAIPVRIAGYPALLWRYSVNDVPRIEIQANREHIQEFDKMWGS